jgi:uncharacterized protein (DUF1697 family)
MTIQIALLRAVNVGGTGKIAMADLRAFMEALGFSNVRTLIQTGNIVFESKARTGNDLETFLEKETRNRLGLDTTFIVRTPEEWEDAIKANPFHDKARDDPKRLQVMSLKDAPATQNVTSLEEAISGPERVFASGRHLYIDYPDGSGNSKLTNVLIERRLETRGTSRNWNTVLKISAMAQAQT